MQPGEMVALFVSGAVGLRKHEDGRHGVRSHSGTAKWQRTWRWKHLELARKRARDGMRKLREKRRVEARKSLRKPYARIRKLANTCEH